MPRKVFFSFYYKGDIRRVVQVRNSWRIRSQGDTQPFLDRAEWESLKRNNPKNIESWIERQLAGSSVTAVLYGTDTYSRPWVRHELLRSYQEGKGILAIAIHNVRDPQLGTSSPGQNPLSYVNVNVNGRSVALSSLYRTYDYVRDDGYNNMSRWIEEAATQAGR